MRFSYIAKYSEKEASYASDKEFERIKRFSRGFYAIASDSLGNEYFCDLRFPSFDFYGESPAIDAVVKYELKKDSKGQLALDRTSPKRKITINRLNSYFARIRGRG
jgi:hypothetical protein